MQEALGDKVHIVGVAGRDDAAAIQGFIESRGVDGFEHAADLDGSIWRTYGVVSQPSFAFIDDDGSVETYLGALGEAGLTERLEALIAQ